MEIVNVPLLLDFAAARECECCKRKVPQCDPNHVFTKGAGRIDARWNLISLWHECHVRFHDGNVKRLIFLQIVAKREGVGVQDIVDAVALARRLPKDATVETVQAVDDATDTAKKMVIEAMRASIASAHEQGQ